MDVYLTYKGYTGVLGDVFDTIKATIHMDRGNGYITVRTGDKQKKIKVVVKEYNYNSRNNYIYLLKKTQLNLLRDYGIKHLIETQRMENAFFTDTRKLMTTILNK